MKTNILIVLGIVVLAVLGGGYYVLRVDPSLISGTNPSATHMAPAAPMGPPAAPAVPAAAMAPKPATPPAAVSAVAPAECLMPGPAPIVPNGAAASEADMKLAHDVIQSFVLQLEAFQTCRNQQVDKAAASVTAAQKKTWQDEGDKAVDEAHALADAYAVQLRVFKARPAAK